MTHANKADPIERAERAGRKGDRLLGHLTPGDVVIPRGRVTEELRALLAQHFDVDRYTAGHEKNSTNPKTGLPEFYDSFGGGMDIGGEQGGYGAMGQEGFAGGYADTGTGGGDGTTTAPAIPQSFWEKLTGFFSNPTAPALAPDSAFNTGAAIVNSAQGDMSAGGSANGGLLDSTQPPWVRADYMPTAQPVAPQVVTPNNVNPLMAPVAPDLPTTPSDVGRYYGALLNNDMALANNLLGPYLSGNKNVYGR